MKITTQLLLLSGAMLFFSLSSLQAQQVQYSKDQIIGKWILKSASYNEQNVFFKEPDSKVSFEFRADGKVTFITSDGKAAEGMFLVKENKLIDPKIPESPSADIISLTENGLVLAIEEEYDKVLMTFELVDTGY